jgi:carboxypeptidase family protein
MKNRFTKLFLAAAIVCLALAPASAQSSNTRVNGTVTDPNGAVVAGATVVLTDKATDRHVSTVSNQEGFFHFPEVRAGSYLLDIERAGFKKTQIQNVVVNVDQPATVNVVLELGDIAETVTTIAADFQAVVNTDNAQLSTTVLERQIRDLPLNGRNPLTLAGLQAGVNTSSTNRSSSVNGLRGSFTNLTWDGININDNFVRTDSFFGVASPSVISVSEFTLTTQNSGPGDGLGVAQVKMVTPRGGSKFHGELFEFHRNDALDANSFFNNRAGLPKEKLIQNQFGGSIGGPFVLPRFGEGGPTTWGKDKLFFYFFNEETRVAQGASRLRTVLTAPARNGQFTYRRLDNGQLQTVNLLGLANLPTDATMGDIIAKTPLPNSGETGDEFNFSGFRFNSPAPSTDRTWGFRIDFDATQKSRFEAVYSRLTSDFPNDVFNDIGEVFPGLPGGGQSSVRPRGALAWIWSPSPSWTNELRGGFNSYDVEFVNREPFADGIQITIPLISNPIQNFQPQGRDVYVRELMDNATWVRGDHVHRLGGNLRLLKVLPFNDAGRLPSYAIAFGAGNENPLDPSVFPGGISTTNFNNASSILALLAGPVDTVNQTFQVQDRTSGFVSGLGERRDLRNYNVGLYFSDSWRARRNLTVNLGLRWEFISVPTEHDGLALLPVGGLDNLFNPNAGLDFAGTGTGRKFFNNDWNNFAPSLSFAWDPWGEGKASIRGGYAISYVIDNNITTVRNAFRGNDGLSQGIQMTGISGTISGAGRVPVSEPAFQVPRTIADNIILDPGSALFAIDPDFRTPYVQQWNIGFEKEIMRDTAFEIRYVGNRGVKLTRGIDINQVRIFDNGFLEDFRRAEFNLTTCGRLNPTAAQCANRQPLQLLPRFGLAGFLTSGTVIGFVRNGEVGELASFYYLNRDFFLSGAQGGDPTLTPSFFAPANPNAFVVDTIGNGSYSNYNALQTEIRRRLSRGLYFQANYTFGKSFSDFEGSQTSFSPLLDNATGGVVEKRRISDDITHVFKANAVYELPFGSGKRFFDSQGFANAVLGGWSLNGIFRWQSGEPVSIVSARGTLNRRGRSGVNTVSPALSVSELQSQTGLFFDPTTGQPLLFNPALIEAVRANPNSNAFLTNPISGTLGSLQLTPVSGPSRLDFDMSLIKRTYLGENTNIEFRAEAFNVLNHTNFDIGQSQSINSANFGRITSTFDPRILQFALKLNF